VKLLRRQCVKYEPLPGPAGFASGAKFLTCALAPWRGAQGIEDVASRPQWRACVRNAALAVQPFAVGQQEARAEEWLVPRGNVETILEVCLRGIRQGEKRLPVGQHQLQPGYGDWP
jgi:hypothetical protein